MITNKYLQLQAFTFILIARSSYVSNFNLNNLLFKRKALVFIVIWCLKK